MRHTIWRMCHGASKHDGQVPMPQFWRAFAGYFGLDDATIRRRWEALCRSRSPLAGTWRQAIVLCDEVEAPSRETVRAFLLLKVPAADIITLLEALVAEGQVPRQRASAIEERVFACMRADGAWH